jgi:hypothetical protein
MIPANYNLPSVVRGDTYNSVRFTLDASGVPIDITGCNIRAMFRRASKLGTVHYTATTQNGGIVIIDAQNGVFDLAQFQAVLPVGRYYYDIEITFPGGVTKTYLAGNLDVLQDVTV